MQIKNSVFLVTGGASGLGAATAQMAAANGAKVVIADLQAEAGREAGEGNRREILQVRRDLGSRRQGRGRGGGARRSAACTCW